MYTFLLSYLLFFFFTVIIHIIAEHSRSLTKSGGELDKIYSFNIVFSNASSIIRKSLLHEILLGAAIGINALFLNKVI